MNGFGLEVEDIPRIHDLIAHAQVTTGITAAEMIDTLLRVAPTARSAGIAIEEMVATLAILVDQGQISERAATSLERTLVQLSKAEVLPPEAKNAIKELGVDIETVQDLMAQGKLIDALKLLSEAGLDVSTASRIFGEDGQRAALTLAAEIPRLEGFRAGLDDIEGSMKKQADTMNRGLSGSWAAFVSSLSAAREALGDAGLRGWMEQAANRVRGFVEAFTTASDPVRRLVAMVLASGPVLLAVGVGLKGVSIALGGLMPVIRGVMLLFSLWGIAAALVAGGAYLIVKNWSKLVDWFQGTFPNAADFVERTVDRIRDAWAQTVEWFESGADFGALWDGIVFGVEAIEWPAVARSLRDGLMAAFNSAAEWASGVEWQSVGETIGEAIAEALLVFFDSIWDLIGFSAEIEGEEAGRRFVSGLVTGLGEFSRGLLRGLFGFTDEFDIDRFLTEGAGTRVPDADTAGGGGRFGSIGGYDIAEFLGTRTGTPALAAAAGGGGDGGTVNRSTTVNIDRIDINAEGADAEGVKQRLGSTLQEQIDNAARDYNSNVAR